MRSITSGMPKPDKGSKLAYLTGIIVSLTAVVGLVFQNKSSISGWVQYAILLAFILVIIFIIYIFFSDEIFIRYNRLITYRKHNKVACKYLSELKISVEKFDRIIEVRGEITGAFEKLRSETDAFKNLNLNDSQLNQIKNLLFNLKRSIRRFDGTGDDFELIIDQFEVIIKIYNELYVKSALIDIRNTKNLNEAIPKNEAIPERIKNDYKTRKDAYEKILDKYIEFGDKVNREYGKDIVSTYSEKFEEL